MGDKDDEAGGASSDEDTLTSHEKRWYALNKSRGVTLLMLMSDGMIQPGKRVLSIDYLGRQFSADLLETGKIKTHDNIFNTPSAWARHCKRIVKPDKKSGCGWASVKYKGTKLDTWKSIWCGKQRNDTPNGYDNKHSTPQGFDNKLIESPLSTSSPLSMYNGTPKKPLSNYFADDIQEEGMFRYYRPISFCLLGPALSIDPNTLVICESFSKYNHQQPFTVSMTTNAMLLMDFHSHLTHSEIVGYLGGKWDATSQHMSIRQIYPCRCRLGDKDRAPIIEEEIKRHMSQSGLGLVGWYHSHPHSPADPSLKDIGCQMMYQLKMKGSGHNYHPCIGFIVSPYDKTRYKEACQIQGYWVMPPLENRPSDYGIPMNMKYNVYQNESLTEELLTEMKKLVQFYQGSEDLVKYRDEWRPSVTYLQKIKVCPFTQRDFDKKN
ncbi:hypothetical protein LOTGIDRAFT_140609 [Lottia gigantea]|uniref:MPN domain-containing protein n=1 Tax=Lottia gigantea TaxID=225164 RepID=V4B008_LOTGI|nr:hypothetical protein LOTGIDRAFT_140609 [Lottia gigantea]ESP00761.1 hypothetical protein LOTGIDRAFT_140609 [Lottia gigantea]